MGMRLRGFLDHDILHPHFCKLLPLAGVIAVHVPGTSNLYWLSVERGHLAMLRYVPFSVPSIPVSQSVVAVTLPASPTSHVPFRHVTNSWGHVPASYSSPTVAITPTRRHALTQRGYPGLEDGCVQYSPSTFEVLLRCMFHYAYYW
jgi:hypothetical protein